MALRGVCIGTVAHGTDLNFLKCLVASPLSPTGQDRRSIMACSSMTCSQVRRVAINTLVVLVSWHFPGIMYLCILFWSLSRTDFITLAVWCGCGGCGWSVLVKTETLEVVHR